MERSPGSAFQSMALERRQPAFRRLITTISEQLQPEEVAKCAFIGKVPRERSSTALDTLVYLLQVGAFSHSNVEPLIKLLQDISRHDLVNDQVDSFLKEHPPDDELSQSVLSAGMTQQIPPVDASNTTPTSITHSSIPPSLATQNPINTTTPLSSYQQPSQEPNSHPRPSEESNPLNSFKVVSSPPPFLTQESSQVDPQCVEPLLPYQHTKIPIKSHDGPFREKSKGATAAVSTTSSMDELEQYHVVGAALQEQAMSSSQPDSYLHRLQHSVTPPTEVSTLPRTNSYPRSIKMSTSHFSAGYVTPPSQLPPVRSFSAGKGIRSGTTTPDALGKYQFPGDISRNRRGSLPKTHGRPPSQTSGHSESGVSKMGIGGAAAHCGNESPAGDVFPPRSISFEQVNTTEGADSGSQHHNGGSEGEQATLFRQRLGSRKRFFTKFTRSRDRASSFISWSVKRRKLNEAIYDHQKDKYFKCPRQLELENWGKYPPILTLYLHPYGYEEDERQNLTLMVTLDISVKCRIASSAVIRIEIEASDSSTGEKLKRGFVDCAADCRIARCMSFMSHKELKDMECDTIEFTASAKLYTTSFTD